jgi:hypothetical protein
MTPEEKAVIEAACKFFYGAAPQDDMRTVLHRAVITLYEARRAIVPYPQTPWTCVDGPLVQQNVRCPECGTVYPPVYKILTKGCGACGWTPALGWDPG